VDLDGTLSATVEAVLVLYNQEYGTHYGVENIRQWHFWNSLPELQSLSEPKRRDKILRLMDRVWNEGLVRPYPAAADFMRELQRYGQVDIVTGRGEGTPTEVIERWLEANGIPYDQIVRVRGGSRGKVLHGYETYLDDDPTLAEDIAERWPGKSIWLINRPWNRRVPESDRVTRVYGYSQVLAALAKESWQARLFRRARPEVRVRRYRRRF
jgi:hypothetical protein